jgi:hypothetical protein
MPFCAHYNKISDQGTGVPANCHREVTISLGVLP